MTSTYRTSPLDTEAPGRPEVISKWAGQTMGGRVPAFMGLAQRTGGVYYENPPSLAAGIRGTDLDFEVRLERMQAVVNQTAFDPETGTEIPIFTNVDVPRFRAAVGHYNDGRTPVVFSTWQSPRYQPIQTADALGWGDALSDGKLAAIGAYGDPVGSKVYAAYDLTGFQVGGKDDHEVFLTITTTHDGTGSMTARVVPIRLACTNETSFYFGKGAGNPSIKVRHTVSAQDAMAQATAVVERSREYLGIYQVKAEQLLKVKQSENDFIAWTRELFGVDTTDGKTPKGAAQVREDALVELWHSDTNDFGRGRAYAGLQTVVEYADHFAPVRGADPVAARQDRLVLGRMDELKDRAFDSLVTA
jgi:hypothetical protein